MSLDPFVVQETFTQGVAANICFASVASMEVKDPHTVIVHTKFPNPILLSGIWIFSRECCEGNNAAEVAGLRKTATSYATLHANGTRAFEVVSREPEVNAVLLRNRDWWGRKKGYGKSNVGQVEFTPIKQDGTRVAALSLGTIDGQNALDNLIVTLNVPAERGRFNYGRYSNPKIDEMADLSRQEFDVAKRTKLMQDAFDAAHSDVSTIPLHYQQVVWASSPKVDVVQRSDNTFVWAWVNVK